MWEILIFKWFLPLKIQINSKKPGFEKSVEDVVTLGPMAQATLVNIILSASDFKCFTLIFPLRGFKTQPKLKWI
jgi:hypothetical protein